MRQGSFVRKGAAAAADPGTRPGLYGQTLVSTGHPDLDRLLGGGLPLGAVLLLLEDGWSSHHATLLRYFLAEGAACGQALMLAAAPAPAGGLPAFIPAQLRRGQSAEKDKEEDGRDEFKLRIAWQYRRYIKSGQQGASSAAPPAGSTAGGSTGGSLAAAGSGIRAGASGGSSVSGSGGGGGTARKLSGLKDWCHQFDLLKSVGDAGLTQCPAQLIDCSTASGNSGNTGGGAGAGGSTQRLVAAAAAFVDSLSPAQQQLPGSAAALAAGAGASAAVPSPPPRGPQHVGRLAVLSLGSLGWQPPAPTTSTSYPSSSSSSSNTVASSTAVLRTLLQLKALVRDRRCAAVVSVPAGLFSPSDLARMQHIADGVVALESLADDSDIVRLAPDPASVAGLLHLRKLPALGTVSAPLPEVALHLVRHKRRRLAITPVDIDPDAELADSEAASGMGRSVASMLCGGPPKAEKAMDF